MLTDFFVLCRSFISKLPSVGNISTVDDVGVRIKWWVRLGKLRLRWLRLSLLRMDRRKKEAVYVSAVGYSRS